MTAALTFVAAASGAAGLLLALPDARRRSSPDRRVRALRILAALGDRIRPGRVPADLRGRL